MNRPRDSDGYAKKFRNSAFNSSFSHVAFCVVAPMNLAHLNGLVPHDSFRCLQDLYLSAACRCPGATTGAPNRRSCAMHRTSALQAHWPHVLGPLKSCLVLCAQATELLCKWATSRNRPDGLWKVFPIFRINSKLCKLQKFVQV
jgi:hypothetical protein